MSLSLSLYDWANYHTVQCVLGRCCCGVFSVGQSVCCDYGRLAGISVVVVVVETLFSFAVRNK